ncbi:MAG TPA: CBS domain-containing protein [Aridibacter sp.]|nr:CBS domain-containing protein [Aridibacter sp.]
MKLVKHLLEEKGNDIWSIEPDRSVLDAIRMMAEKGIGALLIMKGDELMGILSERDYARKVILQGRSSKETSVHEIMTDKVFCTSPESSVEECMALMTEKRIRHLPVVNSGAVIGVLSIGDLVKAKIEEQEFQIKQLENYITA